MVLHFQGRICGEAAAESKTQQDSSQQNTSPRGVLDRPLHSLGTMTTEEGQGRSARFDERELENGRAQAQSFSMDDDHSSEEEDQTEDESCLRRSARNHGTDRLHSVSLREHCLAPYCACPLLKIGCNVAVILQCRTAHSGKIWGRRACPRVVLQSF